MPALICQHCMIVTQVRLKDSRPLLAAEDLAGLHCRACERAGGMQRAFFDRGIGQWRARRRGDVELTELAIDGRLLSLVELETLGQVVGVCDAHRGEWIGVDTVFPLRRNFADQTHRRVIARLIQAGVLAAAGLEMQPERPGYYRLFRAAAAKASVASGQLSVAKGHEPPTTDPAP